MQHEVEKFEIVKMCLNAIIISLNEFGVSWMEIAKMILEGEKLFRGAFLDVFFVFKVTAQLGC